MDKNTFIGILLMGAVIFGFMWLNQPSQEEQEKRRQEQIEAAKKAETTTPATAAAVDSFTTADLNMMRRSIIEYGKSSELDGNKIYSISSDALNATVDGLEITGTLAVDDTVLQLNDIIAGNLPQTLYVSAVKKLKSAIIGIAQYREFSSYLQGTDSVITLANNDISLKISSKGGMITSATLKNYDAFNAPEVELFTADTDSYSFVLNSTEVRYDTKDLFFTPVQENDSTLLMQMQLPGNAMFGIRYTLPSTGYLVKMDVVQKNMQNIIPSSTADMDFVWTQKMSRHEKGEMFEERNSGVFYKYSGGGVENLSESSKDKEDLTDRLKWIGFKNQFFSSVIIADKNFTSANLNSVPIEKNDPEHKEFLKNMSAEATVEYSSASPNPASFWFFFGPNLYPLLSSIDKSISPDESLKLTNLIPLGWSFFRWINTGFIIPIFDFLGKYITNYGLIILILTLIIKLILFPLTYKSMISQAKMRLLAPDIKKINEQYPGQENAMTRQQKTMALYSQAGASPFGGCLPMLLQLPILFAMISFFPSCIELRGEPFLWVKDLSAPDAIVSWNAQIPFITNYFGNHISLFCLLMTVTNIIYSRINMQNQAGSDSMPGMKMMMYLMPLMFLVIFNNYAAGLSYYYFISLLITIIQTYAFRHFVSEEKMRKVMAENAKKPKKKSGFMARLEEAQRQQQAALKAQQQQQKRNNRR